MMEPIDERPGGRISALEWAVSALGVVLVVLVITVLLVRWSGEDDAPADIVVERSHVEEGEGGFRVVVELHNLGGVAAEALTVEGVLRDDAGQDRERAIVVLDMLGARSRRTAVLVFRDDPRRHALELGARGFTDD